jgi:hypothetical protein
MQTPTQLPASGFLTTVGDVGLAVMKVVALVGGVGGARFLPG